MAQPAGVKGEVAKKRAGGMKAVHAREGAGAMKTAMPMTKVIRKSRMAKSAGAFATVSKGTEKKTGGLSKNDVLKNGRGKIVKKKIRPSRAMKSGKSSAPETYLQARMEARKELGLKGWVPIGGESAVGKRFLAKIRAIRKLKTKRARANTTIVKGTEGQLSKNGLQKNRQKIATKKIRPSRAMKSGNGSAPKTYAQACVQARKALGLKGFIPIGGESPVGKRLLAKIRTIWKPRAAKIARAKTVTPQATEKTTDGPSENDLQKKRQGNIVSKTTQSSRAMKSGNGSAPQTYLQACVQARRELGLKGFSPVGGESAVGKRLLAKVRAIWKPKAAKIASANTMIPKRTDKTTKAVAKTMRSSRAMKSGTGSAPKTYAQACVQARKALGLKGFVPLSGESTVGQRLLAKIWALLASGEA